jgi:hypothetical protein
MAFFEFSTKQTQDFQQKFISRESTVKRAELELTECRDEHGNTQFTNDKYLHGPALDLISPA